MGRKSNARNPAAKEEQELPSSPITKMIIWQSSRIGITPFHHPDISHPSKLFPLSSLSSNLITRSQYRRCYSLITHSEERRYLQPYTYNVTRLKQETNLNYPTYQLYLYLANLSSPTQSAPTRFSPRKPRTSMHHQHSNPHRKSKQIPICLEFGFRVLTAAPRIINHQSKPLWISLATRLPTPSAKRIIN